MNSKINNRPPTIIKLPNRSNTGSSTSLISIIGALLLLAISGFAVYYFLFKGSKPPPQTKTYKCQPDGSCIEDPTGQGDYTDPNCEGECNPVPPPPPDRYSCSGDDKGTCKKDPNGSFDSPDNCKCWTCVDNQCSSVNATEIGTYKNKDECLNSSDCNFTKYTCQTKTEGNKKFRSCELSKDGDTLENCQNNCLTYYCDPSRLYNLPQGNIDDENISCTGKYYTQIPSEKITYDDLTQCSSSCSCPSDKPIFIKEKNKCCIYKPDNSSYTDDNCTSWKCDDGYIQPPDCSHSGDVKPICVKKCNVQYACDPYNPSSEPICCEAREINCSGKCCLSDNCKLDGLGKHTCCENTTCFGDCCKPDYGCDPNSKKCKLACAKIFCDDDESCVQIKGNIYDNSLQQLIKTGKAYYHEDILYMCVKKNKCQLSQQNEIFAPPGINNFYPCINNTGTSFYIDEHQNKIFKGVGFAYPREKYCIKILDPNSMLGINNMFITKENNGQINIKNMNFSNYSKLQLYYGKVNDKDTFNRLFFFTVDKIYSLKLNSDKTVTFSDYDINDTNQNFSYSNTSKTLKIANSYIHIDKVNNIYSLLASELLPSDKVCNFEIVELDPLYNCFSNGHFMILAGPAKYDKVVWNYATASINPTYGYLEFQVILACIPGVQDNCYDRFYVGSIDDRSDKIRIFLIDPLVDIYCLSARPGGDEGDYNLIATIYNPDDNLQEIEIINNIDGTVSFCFINTPQKFYLSSYISNHGFMGYISNNDVTNKSKDSIVGYKWNLIYYNFSCPAARNQKNKYLNVLSCNSVSYDDISSKKSLFNRIRANIPNNQVKSYLTLPFGKISYPLVSFYNQNSPEQRWIYDKISLSDPDYRLCQLIDGKYYCVTLDPNNRNALFLSEYNSTNYNQGISYYKDNIKNKNFLKFTNGNNLVIGVIFDNTTIPSYGKYSIGVNNYDQIDNYSNSVCYDWIIEEDNHYCKWVDIFDNASEELSQTGKIDTFVNEMNNYTILDSLPSFGNWCIPKDNIGSNRLVMFKQSSSECNALDCWSKIAQKGVQDVRYDEANGYCMAIQDCTGTTDFDNNNPDKITFIGNTTLGKCDNVSCPEVIKTPYQCYKDNIVSV